jgi:hypothetical protein
MYRTQPDFQASSTNASPPAIQRILLSGTNSMMDVTMTFSLFRGSRGVRKASVRPIRL